MTEQVLLVGAHPDDVELGAGGLIHELIRRGIETFIVVVSDDTSSGPLRRSESMTAAEELGVPTQNVLFLGLSDGAVTCDHDSIDLLRAACAERGIDPQLVVTHTDADSHNDHRAVNELCRAAFRHTAFLFLGISLSVETRRFTPSIFVELTRERQDAKGRALAAHSSQEQRIGLAARRVWEEELGRKSSLAAAEGFEVEQQIGGSDGAHLASTLNDSPLHRFWNRLAPTGDVVLVDDVDRAGAAELDLYPNELAFRGLDALRLCMTTQMIGVRRFNEVSSESAQAFQLVRPANAVLAGGPVSNRVARELINHSARVRWVVDYDRRGDAVTIFIRERTGSIRFDTKFDASGRIRDDFAVLTVMTSDFDPERVVVSCAGIHGVGTQALLLALAEPGSAPKLLDAMLRELAENGVAQRVLRCDGRTLEVDELLDLASVP